MALVVAARIIREEGITVDKGVIEKKFCKGRRHYKNDLKVCTMRNKT